jgi:uncharacterized protein (DUF2147 family)
MRERAMLTKPKWLKQPRRNFRPSPWLGLLMVVASSSVMAQAPAGPQGSPIDGQWLTPEQDAVIEIASCQGQITRCARIIWIKPTAGKPNEVFRDVKNPQPELQNRELCGLEIITGLKPTGNDSYDGAVLYDPEEGQTVTGAAKRVGPNIKITGYLAGLGPLLSESQVLTPAGNTFTPCAGTASAPNMPPAKAPAAKPVR